MKISKKLIISFLSFMILSSSVFAYTPTQKDKSMINSITPIFRQIAKTDTQKANTYLKRLNNFKNMFVSSNPRFAYIFGAIANAIEDELEINNDGDYQINVPDTLIYITALDGTSVAANLDAEKFGCDDKLYPISVKGALTPQKALEEMFAYRVATPHYTDYTETYNVFDSSDIQIKSFEIKDKTAIIYLQGNLYVGGMCENPRIFAQINQTLTQFPNIDNVKVYINDESLESFLSEK